MKIKPLNDYIIIEKIKQKTKGEVILPDNLNKDVNVGNVAFTGLKSKFKKGQKVIFGNDHEKIIIEDKEYYSLLEDNIIGSIE